MASSNDDEVIESLLRTPAEPGPSPASYGDDTMPLVSRVADPHPSNWGKLTSRSRTASDAYMRFLNAKR